jgi:RNA polymerase sigma-70 factor, ECF subfamily
MKKIKSCQPGGTDYAANCPKVSNEVSYDSEPAEDEALIARCRTGNMVAFGQLVERYQDRLFNAVSRMVGNQDDALEITQEAFYRAMKGLKKFRGSAGFFTWLYRIGMNLCINHHRRSQRVHITSLQSGNDVMGRQADHLAAMARSSEYSPDKQVQIKESYDRVLTAMETLEPSARAVVVLRDIEQLHYGQIAQILELPIGTVKSRLSRARGALREQLL